MDEPRRERPWWMKLAMWFVGTIAVAAIGWTVKELLDDRKEAGDPPVKIGLETDPAKFYAPSDPGWQTYGFVSRGDRRQLGTPPSPPCRNWRSWALKRGGVDPDQTRLYLSLQGKADTAVLVTGVDVEFDRRSPAPEGTFAWCPTEGATASPTAIDVDLDSDPPEVRYAQRGDDYPMRRRLLLTLRGPETEIIELTAHTRRCDCEWRVRVHLRVDGKRVEAVVDDDGKPFHTTASARSEHVQWDGRAWRSMSRADWQKTQPMRWADFRP